MRNVYKFGFLPCPVCQIPCNTPAVVLFTSKVYVIMIHIKSVDMFMIYTHVNFRIPVCNGLLSAAIT
jgi:hypothetical protein